MTNEQIQRIYNTKMRNLMQKNARIAQEQDDADRAALQKQQESNAQINLALTAANMTKDLYEWRQSKLLKIEYGGEGETLPSGAMPTKYKIKEDMPFKEKFTPKGALESLKRLTPKGGLEEREGYKEFKAKETAIEAFESPEFLAKKEAFKEQALKDLDAKQLETRSKEMLREPTEATFPQATAQSTFESQYENIVFEGAEPDYEELGDFIVAENEWLKKGKTDLTSEELSEIGKQFAPGLVDAEISGTGMAGIPVGFVDGKTKIQSIKASPQMIKLSQELKLSPESFISMTDQIDAKKFNQYDLTKTRAQELSNILESEGVVIPPGMTEEKTLELLSSFDKVPMGGTDQKEYRAFVDTLKSGSQNPDTFQSVVTDLTENTDQTIQSAIDGTYVPAVEDVSYESDILGGETFLEDEQAFLFDDPGMGTVEAGAPGDEFIEAGYTKELEEWQRDLGIEEPGVFKVTPFFTLTAEELENMPAPAAITLPTGTPTPTDPEWGTYASPGEIAAEDKKLKALRDIQTTPGVTPEVSSDPELEKALQGLEELDQPIPKAIESEGAPIDFASTEGFVKPDVDVPDAKPGGKFVGKTLGALQTLQTMQGIGQTLTNEEASGADKALAGTQAAKMLADMAAKKAGQKTAVEAVKAGTKIGGKAAVGAAAGGAIGAYTAVTEAKEAGEAWKEKDYDEAILHGMGSASGVLQTAGTGMMLTGVGSPIGAVLYGIGTAGSVISSAGLMLEGLFGGGAPALPEVPKFNASRYLDSIRKQREYAY